MIIDRETFFDLETLLKSTRKAFMAVISSNIEAGAPLPESAKKHMDDVFRHFSAIEGVLTAVKEENTTEQFKS